MQRFWILAGFTLLLAAPLEAQTLELRRPALEISAARLFGAARPVALRLGLKPLPARLGIPELPTPLAPDRSGPGALPPAPSAIAVGAVSTPVDPGAPLAAFPTRLWSDGHRSPAAAERSARLLPADTVARDTVASRQLPVLPDFADLGMRVTGRGELGGAWTQFRPCESGLRLNCNPALFPRLEPEVQFGVEVGGTISDRLHIDVDYDQRREFDATNNINVHYQGLPGELLQRVEVGDVSIGLPASQFMTRGIPAGNFGFKATGELGAMDVQAVWAQQKGDISTRTFRLGGVDGATGLVQDARLVLDDANYVDGQFFYVVDPDRIFGAPHFDPQTLVAADAAPQLRPRSGSLVLYRDEGATFGNFQQQAQPGQFLADAFSEDGTLKHSGLFRTLEPGIDYYVHPSGLWVMLRSPLREDEALAASYITAAGDTVGAPNAERFTGGGNPALRLLRGPVTIHQPNQPTWRFEMHQVYRLDSSSNVDLASIRLVISLGQESGGDTFRSFLGERITLLRLFGLDDDAPVDALDEAHLFTPGASEGPGASGSNLATLGIAGPSGTFVVFPTLEPFKRPPPVPSEGLSAPEALLALEGNENPVIYDAVDPVVRRSGTRYRLNFDYRVRTEGVASTFSLGAFGIRDDSERITLDGRLLQPDVDYVVDYELGTVTLTDGAALLAVSPDAELVATWEQQALFQVAPTTVVGLNARYELGDLGEVNLVGLSQSEKSLARRPQLGVEAGAVVLGGANGRLSLSAPWLDRALSALPGPRGAPSAVDITGELALSVPRPNTRGDTYLDDFESTDALPLSLETHNWRESSRPQSPDGALDVLPWPLGLDNAASLVWQDQFLAAGREAGFLLPQEIDQQINFAGAQLAERALYLTAGGESRVGSTARWRSIVTALSSTGRDLSRTEFLEFYAAPFTPREQQTWLVFDIGTVSEDAFHTDENGELRGTAPDGRPYGLDVLDEEARLALREVWGPVHDARGLWAEQCVADRLNPVPLGDERANCTVQNGRPDTEDLNGNGVLDADDGQYFRYVVPMNAGSRYIVRGQVETGSQFRLFRVPLRGNAGTAVNGANEATWRFIKHIRVTVVTRTPGRSTLILARLNMTGSRWTKRDVHGVLDGLGSDRPGLGAASTTLRVGPASQVTDGAGYVPPPGVLDQVQDPSTVLGGSGVEFNEKSLRLSYEDLEPDERGEVFFRYPQQPRNFMAYRQMRFWALPREGRWGAAGDQRLVIKVGTDARNHYLYQSPLQDAVRGGVSEASWLPERVVDFQQWFRLKAEAEALLIARQPGDREPVTVWSPDSTYAVVMEDRSQAPNLRAVREISLAVYNGGSTPSRGEVWIDDIRLAGAVEDAGFAGRVDIELDAADFLEARVSVGNRGGRFQQLNEDASYLSTGDLSVATTARLGRLAPESWGLEAPLTVSYERTASDPIFLEGSDVPASRLESLRRTSSVRRRVGLVLRKRSPSDNPVLGALIDGMTVRVGYTSAGGSTLRTESDDRSFDGGLSYDRRIGDVGLDIVPGFLEAALRWLLPAAVEESEAFDRLSDARLRLTPERLNFAASFHNQQSRSFRFGQILRAPEDAEVAPIVSPRQGLDNRASIRFRPFDALTADLSISSSRDLLEPDRATQIEAERRALAAAAGGVGGVDLGWERRRTVASTMAYRPSITDWLRPSVTYSARFGLDRNPSHIETVALNLDSASVLQRTFHGERQWTRTVLLQPGGLVRSILGAPPDSTEDEGALEEATRAVVERIRTVELVWNDGQSSRFDREIAEPGFGYQIGLGGLDEFRFIGQDTAVHAIDRDGFRVRSGLQLMPQAVVDIAYARTETQLLDNRAGDRAQIERSWPDVSLTWHGLPLPESLDAALDDASITAGYTRNERSTVIHGPTPRIHAAEDVSIPLQLSLGIAGRVRTSYTATLLSGSGLDPTGEGEHAAVNHAVDLSGRFRAPGRFRDQFPEPIRATVRYDYQAQDQCRVPLVLGARACTPFVDFINRRLDLTLDTVISDLNIGLQASYTDRRSFVGTRTGSTQFQLGLFGQFLFEAGNQLGGPR